MILIDFAAIFWQYHDIVSDAAGTENKVETRVEQLERTVAELTRERDLIRSSYDQLLLEMQLLKRRIFVAKAERVDTSQLEMEFAGKLAEIKSESLKGQHNPLIPC